MFFFSYYKLGDNLSIKFIDENLFDIYIIKDRIKNINFDNDNELKDYLKKIFKTLKDKYLIIIEGFYNVYIYMDKYYGIVINLQKEKFEYYNYHKGEVDMKISVIKNSFLYQLDSFNIDNTKIHIIDNNMYLEIINDISNKDLFYIIENSKNILYDYSK